MVSVSPVLLALQFMLGNLHPSTSPAWMSLIEVIKHTLAVGMETRHPLIIS